MINSSIPSSRPNRYRAFISYSHADSRWGDWLHKALETYRVPKALVGQPSRTGPIPKRLYPIFRDREELPTAVSLSEQIEQALTHSEYVIVICSPRSATSRWVNEEILSFKRLGRSGRILAMIVDGEPNASDRPDEEARECFPPALRFELASDGSLGTGRTEPIAADAREGKDGKQKALLKLIAGLLGVNFDSLVQRELQRQRQRRRIGMTIAFLAVAIGSSVGWKIHQSQQQAKLEAARAQFERAQRLMAELSTYWTGVEQLTQAMRQGLPDDQPGLAMMVRGVFERRRDWTRLYATPAPLHDGLAGTTQLRGTPVAPPMMHFESDQVGAVDFSPHGRWVVTGSSDKTARVWDAATGKPVTPPMMHENHVCCVAFSPNGQRIVTGSWDKTARVWDAATGMPITPPIVHAGSVYSVAFSPDGQWVVTGTSDSKAQVWDAATGAPVSPPIAHEDRVESVAFSPSGRWVVTGSYDHTARVWDAATGAPISPPMVHESFVESTAFSPDGRWVATGSADNTARVWDAATGSPITPPVVHASTILSVVFSPDGRWLATGSMDGTARVWDAATGSPIIPPMVHGDPIASIAFSPDGRWILTGSADKTARMWDAATGKLIALPMVHTDQVRSVVISTDGRWVATGSSDRTARVWEATWATDMLVAPPMEHGKNVLSVATSPNGQWVATGGQDNTARVWNTATGSPVSPSMAHENWVSSVAFSPDGQRVVTGSQDKTARVWDAATGSPITPPMVHEDSVWPVAFSPDGKWIVTGSGNKARVWSATTGAPKTGPMIHENAIKSIAFSPNGRWVATGSGNTKEGTVRMWDAVTGTPITPPMVHEGFVQSVVFSPDGHSVVSGSYDKTARVWDSATGTPITPPMVHEGFVRSVAFSPDGQWIATGSGDKTARVWDAATGMPTIAPMIHSKTDSRVAGLTNGVRYVAFSQDGQQLATITENNRVQIWDAATGTEITAPMVHAGTAYSVAFSRDGGWIVEGSQGNSAQVWNATSGLPSDQPSIELMISTLLTCIDLPNLARSCAPSAPDVTKFTRLLDEARPLSKRDWLRYQVLGDPSANPRLFDTEFAGNPLILRQHLAGSSSLLRYWWESTGYLSLGSASVLAELRDVGDQSEALLRQRTVERMIEDASKPEYKNAIYLPSAEEIEVAKIDLRLVPALLAERGDLRLGQIRRPLWHLGNVVKPVAALAPVQATTSTDCTGDCTLRYPAPVSIAANETVSDESWWKLRYNNPQQAIVELRKAAAADPPDPVAIRHLAGMLEQGFGVERDLAEAQVQWLRSADLGDADAQFGLAVRTELGTYVDNNGDPAEAMRWYSAAARQGHARAAYRLGQMYEEGVGDRVDPTNAAAWYRLAALQGHTAAHYALARVLLETPSLVARNRKLAEVSLRHLRDFQAPKEDLLHELHWLQSEAQLLARQQQ